MVDFPIRKRDFRVRSWSGAFWEPQERKKEKTKCSYTFTFAPFQMFVIFQDSCIIFSKIRHKSC